MVDVATTQWFIQSLTGDQNSVVDFRAIHDKDKGAQGVNIRGTLDEVLSTLVKYNEDGYGIFCNINAMDGGGSEYVNIQHIRTHVVDLDNTLTAEASYSRAGSGTFAVQSSPGKFHVYWRVEPYTNNEFFTHIQRKLAQLYDGDKSINDATRVMRVPGFLHQKGEPFLVTAWPLSGQIYTHTHMEQMLAGVNVIQHLAARTPLGSPDLSAPNLDWVKRVMADVDPNEMDRLEWLSMSAAIKQSAWLHTDEETIYQMWSDWCGQYGTNDDGENRKLWGSIKDTEVGWKSLMRRSAHVSGQMTFYGVDHDFKPAKPPEQTAAIPAPGQVAAPPPPPPTSEEYGEMLSEHECQQYFKDCFFVQREGKIFSKSGRFLNSNQFNGMYGGKQFIVTSTGKCTDEPWKAALRSTLWTIPKVDHTRFRPEKPMWNIEPDSIGRPGLNTYIPANIKTAPGDVSLWLDHVQRILPVEEDRDILMSYLAHCVKFPGHKIPWSPLLQSAEGIGKGVFFDVMQYALGEMYIYSPSAPELAASGNKFNAWMSRKLLIMVNEIRVDEKRELIEILKPMITDRLVEVQAKGQDQDMEDNPANWLFFSNFKDAIPVTSSGRRYSIFYSALQTANDIERAGMDDPYFARLWTWLREGGGFAAVAHWLNEYPVECNSLPFRSPFTSSQTEALERSRSPMETVIHNCVHDQVTGFQGGYISSLAVIHRCKAEGIRQPRIDSVRTVLEGMDYKHIGRADRCFMQEDVTNRAEIFGNVEGLTVEGYGAAQGYQ